MRNPWRLARTGVGTVIACIGCSRSGKPIAQGDTSKEKAPASAAGNVATFTRTGETTGLDSPESAIFDSTQGVWFVSNIVGGSTEKDHNGFISRLKSDGLVDSLHFIKSGANGALLDAPKGLALHGDTIWTADIDVARAFDSHSGKPLAIVDFRPLHAKMLNAVAIGPDGRVYITDTGIQMAGAAPQHVGPDRIFLIDAGLQPRVAVEDSAMDGPNGISWDRAKNHFVVVGFMGPAITTWTPGAPHVQPLTKGVGQFDGNEVLPDGRALVSSWTDSSLYVLVGGSLRRVVAGGLPTPADLHVNPQAMTVAIPLSSQNEIVYYSIPRLK